MAISMSELKKGLKIEMDGIPYRITEYQHVKPGKGAAFVRCKIKSFLNGKVIEKTFHAGDKCEVPDLKQQTMQYLYDDGEMLQFMNTETYDQIGLTHDQVGDAAKWIIDGMNVDMMFFNGEAITVEPPAVVELKIVETPPNFKGDSQGGKKPATLESGAVVQIPFHIVEGDSIKVDTKTGEYLEKVK
ncbi:elongation factor P [Candidatus Marinarcus aquaticus]|uniref:Elongation factor P n=1 Tax=Candidatus Marinarcus aquaticus TaxID=2044504 RepID=A0A4Q0XRK5_9BACT|nr:elongation factor P [Candidatus Marinarcus aquaticus]RXJ57707.1 elongation factor P [Candidatus Marinarcus aquaticus]